MKDTRNLIKIYKKIINENFIKEKYPIIHSGSWTFQVTEETPEQLKTLQTLKLSKDRIETFIGIYNKKYCNELKTTFFIIDEKKGSPECLPHGFACIIKEWDIILVRNRPPIDMTEPLSSKTFTILAHEIGHIMHYKNSNSPYENLTYGEKEIESWNIAYKMFGNNPKFDKEYAENDIKSYQQ